MDPRVIVWRVIAPADPQLADRVEALLAAYERTKQGLSETLDGELAGPAADRPCRLGHSSRVAADRHRETGDEIVNRLPILSVSWLLASIFST
jgi:hypothetical protein